MPYRTHTVVSLIFLVLAATFLTGCAGREPRPEEPFTPTPVTLPKSALEPTAPPFMELIYPHLTPGDTLIEGSIPDSVFMFGNVSNPRGKVTVNGEAIPVHKAGGWLAWIELERVVPLEDSTGSLQWEHVAPVTIRYTPPSQRVADGNRAVQPEPLERRIWFVEPVLGPLMEAQVDSIGARLTVTDSIAVLRCGWPGTYDLFVPEGTVMWADRVERGWRTFYRVPLGTGFAGWIEDRYVVVDTAGAPPKQSVVYALRSSAEGRDTKLRVPLREKIPFRVRDEGNGRLVLTLYGAMSWTDVIIQPGEDSVVEEFRWAQRDTMSYEITAFLKQPEVWGWFTEYDDQGDLVWTIRKAPEIVPERPLKGLRVVVDAGHGGDNLGAIGPTGLTEKEANLLLLEPVAEALQKAGAEVVPVRTDDRYIGLHERKIFAHEVRADVLLSLHYNGLPQGYNPYGHHGTSVHYYHRHSYAIARALYGAITRAVGWDGDGLRYQDLALPRYTGCPSVLIENGFLLHPVEEQLAKDPAFRRAVAKGIRNGLETWLRQVARKGNS